jgi:enolase
MMKHKAEEGGFQVHNNSEFQNIGNSHLGNKNTHLMEKQDLKIAVNKAQSDFKEDKNHYLIEKDDFSENLPSFDQRFLLQKSTLSGIRIGYGQGASQLSK